MKKILFITLFLLCYGTFIIKGQEEVSSELPRKKVGVVLSGVEQKVLPMWAF